MAFVLGQSAEALVGIDEGGIVVLWNDAAERLLGRRRSAALGHPCYDVLRGLTPGGSHLCGPDCAVREACVQLRAPRRFEMVVRHPDGTDLWLEVMTCIVRDERHRPIALHLISEAVAARHLVRLAETVAHKIAPAQSAPATAAEAADELHITQREHDVLALLAQGEGTAQIAVRLQLARATVRNHIQNLLSKLGAHSRAEAVVFGLRQGLIQLH